MKNKDIDNNDTSIYLYNTAPDALPMHKNISAALTHKINIPKNLIEKYPKLIYVKYHLLVDNLGHYNSINIINDTKDSFSKWGYAYAKGKIIHSILKDSPLISDKIDDNDILYLSHIIVEVALDYKLFQDDKSVVDLFFQTSLLKDDEILEEYYNAMSELYNIDMNIIKSARSEPLKFYKTFISPEDFFLKRRSMLILRKLKKSYSDKNIAKVVNIITETTKYLDDYKDFLKYCIDEITKIDDIINLKIN